MGRANAIKKHKLVYFVLAGMLAIPLLSWYGGIRIFSVLGYPLIDPVLDSIATGLILVGGSDRIAAMIKITGVSGASQTPSQPIEITGKLFLQDETSGKLTAEDQSGAELKD